MDNDYKLSIQFPYEPNLSYFHSSNQQYFSRRKKQYFALMLVLGLVLITIMSVSSVAWAKTKDRNTPAIGTSSQSGQVTPPQQLLDQLTVKSNQTTVKSMHPQRIQPNQAIGNNIIAIRTDPCMTNQNLPRNLAGCKISQKYNELQSKGFGGRPLTPVLASSDRVGYFRYFSSNQGTSAIYWTPNTGAHELQGAILSKWRGLGNELGLGYPLTDELNLPSGRGFYVQFQKGYIISTPSKGTYVTKSISGLPQPIPLPIPTSPIPPPPPTTTTTTPPPPTTTTTPPPPTTTTTTPPPPTTTTTTQVYDVYLRNIDVRNTRAAHNDDDYVSLAASSGNQEPQKASTFVGGVNNGQRFFNLHVGPIKVEAGQSLTLDYIIENKGGGISGNDLATVAELAATGLGKPQVADGIASAQRVLAPIFPGFFTSGACNGIVAADRIVLSSTQLDQMPYGSVHGENRGYPGTNSPIGCGSNSYYYVYWYVDKGCSGAPLPLSPACRMRLH